MSDDFPNVEEVLSSRPRRSSRATTKRARSKRARSGGRKSRAKSGNTASDRRVLSDAAGDIFEPDDDEQPKGKKAPKGAIEKIADKVTQELNKKGKRRGRVSAAQRRKEAQQSADLAKKLLGIGKTPLGTLVKTGGALAIGSTAALALIAGAASYYGTTYIINRLAESREARTPSAIRFEAAQAYRQARLEAARKLGRELSAEEQRYLGQQFKQKLATIGG